jgi:hypothetical protein
MVVMGWISKLHNGVRQYTQKSEFHMILKKSFQKLLLYSYLLVYHLPVCIDPYPFLNWSNKTITKLHHIKCITLITLTPHSYSG